MKGLESIFITKCARCGEGHLINFKMFSRNRIDEYNYWGMCPVVNEPVLLTITQNKKSQGDKMKVLTIEVTRLTDAG